ncbi:acyl carrier protein [Obesumbacterium proteus]|uniref:acyl carrier protein n=1 Tax=Obesumbacterium proteus TaxID=82983 RepID=UPI00242DC56C|nr:acyl carrier protein [Obesumbacterium proteus]
MQSNVEKQVKAMMAGHLSVNENQLGDEVQLVDDLYIDSLDLLDIVISLNDKFGIDLGGDEIVDFKTVADICRAVQKQLFP